MSEEQYKQKLLEIIKSLKDKKISEEKFVEQAQNLGKEFDRENYRALRDFNDEELGWAKYWIEEISYYGFPRVQNNHFNFFDYLEKSTNQLSDIVDLK